MGDLIAVGITLGIGSVFGRKLIEVYEAKKALRAERKRREQKRKAFAMVCEDFRNDNI
ncbi:hypothetical protein EUAN_09000 [Andreesenia angusta]|uniref:Uncharacterized protein n=1 Tax=Andreesenia angusta TaxID=39480 RepID=A0A1S1V939_9FIRM|nr:hypothetical protein [Andreesenia angusta]OHW63116.1 hypothetical protein EUAN_09000 [Andreesenia angusta]